MRGHHLERYKQRESVINLSPTWQQWKSVKACQMNVHVRVLHVTLIISQSVLLCSGHGDCSLLYVKMKRTHPAYLVQSVPEFCTLFFVLYCQVMSRGSHKLIRPDILNCWWGKQGLQLKKSGLLAVCTLQNESLKGHILNRISCDESKWCSSYGLIAAYEVPNH